MSDRVIVSRHYGAIEFIARELGAHPTDGIDYYWDDPGAWTCDRREVAGLTVQFGGPPSRIVVNVKPSSPGATDGRIPVLTGNVEADDIQDRIVYGNLLLHLAALASEVYVVEFPPTFTCPECDGLAVVAAVRCRRCKGSGEVKNSPPRGTGYSLADMLTTGARLARYKVLPLGDGPAHDMRHSSNQDSSSHNSRK